MTRTARLNRKEPNKAGQQHFDRANAEYDAGNFETALEFFDLAILAGVEDEVIYNNRGATLDALGKGQEAVESYLKAVSISGRYELAWHNLANSLFAQELYSDAAAAYAKAAALNKDRIENVSGLAQSYVRSGRLGRARAVIKRLHKFAERDPTILLIQSELFVDAESLALAKEGAEEYVKLRPEDPEGLARLGNVEHEAGEYGGAISSYEKALKLAPNDKELWNNLGYTCFVAGFFDRAIQSFDKAIELDPLYKHAWYNKGYAFHGADMLERAVESYEHAIKIDANDAILWNNLGNALYNLGRYRESIPKYAEALNVDPDYDIAWNNIGNALEKMGEYAEAIPYHDRSLEITPDFDYALFAKGVCRAETGELEEGYDLVLESLDLNPTYDEAWGARAEIAERMGRMDEALLAVDESIAVNPEFDEGWTRRGEILLTMGDAEAAEASFEMALKCLEDSHTETASGLAAVVRRGEILTRLGRLESALVNIETVVLSGKMNSKMMLKDLGVRRLMGRYDVPNAVIEAMRKITEPDVIAECARFLLDAGNLPEAERLMSVVRGVPAQTPALRKVQALVLMTKGELEAALAVLGGGGDSLSETDVLLLDAEALETKGEFEKAADVYTRILGFFPSVYSAAVGLARTKLRLKEAESSLSAADIAIGIDPDEWEPHKLKADAFRLLNYDEMAQTELNHARRLLTRSGLNPDETIGR